MKKSDRSLSQGISVGKGKDADSLRGIEAG